MSERRLGSLTELAGSGLASEPTLRAWIKGQPDRPWILKRGTHGDAYEIDLDAAIEAWRDEEREKLETAKKRSDMVRQMALEWGLSGETVDDGGFQLSIAERKQLLEEEYTALRLAEKRREMVKVASVEAVIGDLLVQFRQRGVTFAARLAKKIDLTRDQITAIDSLMSADQAELAQKMENWGKDIGNEGSEITAA